MASLIGATAPYGMKAIRQMKASNTTGRPHQPTARQAKRKQETIDYFKEKVDPILGDCVTHLLLEQPPDIIKGMVAFLQSWDGTKAENMKSEHMTAVKPRKELKLYLATTIGPVVAKLANRVAVKRPQHVIAFMLQELENMKHEDALIPDKPAHAATSSSSSAHTADKAHHVPASAEKTVPPKAVATKAEMRNMQIAVFGVNNSGKSTIVNMLQGKFDPKMKPTVGFRPISMRIGEDMTVRFYDLGGGKRIRDIWSQYYHDVHGIIYVIDASVADDPPALKETIEVFQQTLDSSFLKGKPLLILANKQDLPAAKNPSRWQMLLPIPIEYHEILYVRGCSAFIPEDVDPETYQMDPSIESAIDELCTSVLDNYSSLHSRVQRDSAIKTQEEAKKRIEKERRVLRNKIATAFIDQLSPQFVEENQLQPDLNNIFDVEEGVTFLVGETGEDLPPLGRTVAAMVGYQRLALQIVGALKSPISKKKTPMTWEEIYNLVAELREELGLPKI